MSRPTIPALMLLSLVAIFEHPTAWCQIFDTDVLAPNGLYHRTNRPIPAVLAIRGGLQVPEDGFQIVLLDADGSVLDTAEGLEAGELDLADLMPAILDLEQAARIQLVADGLPVGTPLVIEPLIGRAPIRTVRDVRPDGRTRYTRIIGFGEDLVDPEDEADRQALESMRTSPDWEEGEVPILSGFRTYLDRDVLVETDFGEIRIDLAPETAPNTAWNFRHLAEHGFYDDTIIHRIVHMDASGRRFVIQGGDPTGGGSGGPGYDLPMERSSLPHDLGVISMARADHPDSAGSQWFICLSREGTARLDGQYCAFGWASSGAEPIARIADTEIGNAETGRPTHPPRVARMRLIPAEPLVPGVPRTRARIQSWWTAPETGEPQERRTR
ncbi:MAG: peptidylprolyl isomerase [Planctomycetota bacterium]|nr:peptidylprolyl isomerase [Planctomycetota bacterium]